MSHDCTEPLRPLVAPLLLVWSIACTLDPTTQGLNVEIVERVTSPVDAAPSADGLDIFVITDSNAGSQLLELHAGGVKPLASFEHAQAVVADSSGLVYVADTGPDAVFAVDGEGNVTMVEGTDGYGVRGLHLGDELYFVGDGYFGPALYSVPPEGTGVANLLAVGFPGVLDGVTQAADGTLYLTGEAAAGVGVTDGALFELVDYEPVVLAQGLHLGSPAGVAITPDDTTVMVSSVTGCCDSGKKAA